MKLGAMNNPMVDIIEEIQMVADLGFDFIDLTLEPEQTYSAAVNVNQIAKALSDTGLEATGHTAWYLPIASPFPELREAAIQELLRCIGVFADLGITKMNVHPYMRVPLHDEDWITSYNIEAIAKLVERGKELDIKILVENMPQFSHVSQLKPIMETIPEALLLLDVGHSNLDGPHNYAEELIANFGHRLGHVHISDNRGGHDDMHLPLGVGNIKWPKIVRALKNAGYDDTITIEVFGDDDDYLVMSRKKIAHLWDIVEPGT